MIKLDLETYLKPYNEELDTYKSKFEDAKNIFNQDMTGWMNLEELSNKELINQIKRTSDFIRNNTEVFLVIGIGGSYMGSKAVISALLPYFYNYNNTPELHYLGNSLSSEYLEDLWNKIKNKSIMVNVISKSGSTTEIKVAYDFILNKLKEKYTEAELTERIIITTDKEEGLLRKETNLREYKSFSIPNSIGGRFSVFTPAGLLPIAVMGIDIDKLLEGAKKSLENMEDAYNYASIRKILIDKDYKVESYVTYEPKMFYLLEWLKQLYGESLGKDGKGLLPVSFINSRDLHSLGQYVQDGPKILFETVLNIENSSKNTFIGSYNKNLEEINNIASKSVSTAHFNGGVPNILININEMNEETLGYLLQFFMISVSLSGYLEEVNPYNQDGVEEYKKIMNESL